MFKSELVLVALTPDLWFLDEPLIWDTPQFGFTVPAGFITDDASIPHIVDWIPFLDRTGLSRLPGVGHDWLYAGMRYLGKAVADDLLREMLIAEGMSRAGAEIIYKGVSWFGETSWQRDGRKLVLSDFRTPADYRAWLATGPIQNAPAAFQRPGN